MVERSYPEGAEALVHQWRKEAARFRALQAECDIGDEEYFLSKTEAERLEKCAFELERIRAVAQTADDLETCHVCMGSGYSNHPDSGEVCHACGGNGGIRPGGVAQAVWQPIETAPKPNVNVLIWHPWMEAPRKGAPPGFAYIARWTGTDAGEDCWRDPVDFEPIGEGATHWMPLPAPPSTLSSTDRVTLPGHDETMANLNALTISPEGK